MTGQILFDTFAVSSSFMGDVGSPVIVLLGGLLLISLFVKLRHGNQ